MEIAIPDMSMWTQIGGDMDPAKYGGTIARSDGGALELLKIQPVREYVGDDEAREVGFPFWTREGWYDVEDLKRGMSGALQFIGMDEGTLEAEYTPTQRALVIAEALMDYGQAEEGPSGWSSDIYADEEVKWQDGRTETIEDRLSEEDAEFRDEILGWGEIKEKLEEASDQMIDESAAQGVSQLDDQTMIDLEQKGFEDQTAFNIADIGDAIAVNGEALLHPEFAREIGIHVDQSIPWSEVGSGELEAWLDKKGYEITGLGGRVPEVAGYAYADHVVQRVARETERTEETVAQVAETLDWWQDEIQGYADGYAELWAKPLEEETE